MLSSDSLKKIFPALRDDSLSMQNSSLSGVEGLQNHLAPGSMFIRKNTGYSFHQPPEETVPLPTDGTVLREKQPNSFSCVTDINLPNV